MGLLQKIKDLFPKIPKIKDISGERLLEHLKNIGIEAEKIPTGSLSERRPLNLGNLRYSSSVKVKGLNINLVQINNRYSGEIEYYYDYYLIDYIVIGFYPWMSHLKRKLKKSIASIPSSMLIGLKQEVKVSIDEPNRCVRIHGRKLDRFEVKVVDEDGKRVEYRCVNDIELPSRETIEAYDRIASHVRSILEESL